MRKRYRVVFTDESKLDIQRSVDWGRREWGREAASQWYKRLRERIQQSLPFFPLGHPIAPETEDLGFEVLHMIIDRYRVLFEIVGKTVRILHLRGPYIGPDSTDLGVDE